MTSKSQLKLTDELQGRARGGVARAAALTPERRSEIARLGGLARKGSHNAARPPPAHGWAIVQRLRFIDFLLAQYGTLNRGALMDYFGISTPQASADIKAYLQFAPGNAVYDRAAKTYRRTEEFKRVWP
jgi:hypothetical protein